MRNAPLHVTALLLMIGSGLLAGVQTGGGDLAWPEPTAQSRPWAYWWWMGSAVDEANLTRRLQDYATAGYGGVHVVPIYGVRGQESREIPYLSERWMAVLAHAAKEARRLGMGLDMSTGTGWCFGGPNITGNLANGRLVHKVYRVEPGAKFHHKFSRDRTELLVAFGPEGRVVDLTPRIGVDGAVDWAADGGPWSVYALTPIYGRPAVKRAAPGGAGPMLNPFSAQAIEVYLQRFEAAFAGIDGPLLRAMYHDSFEYHGGDWSPELLAEFERRRGYPLQEHLPSLLGGTGETAARVKADYRRTLAEMLADNFLGTWVAWSHRHGWKTRNQAHGSPGNLLDLYAAADMPETEMFRHDRDPLVAKFASSAAHVTGKKLVTAETGTWLAEHFQETLGGLRGMIDELFIGGVNHIFYHGTCYSPDEAAWPGWLFYASTQMNERNPIWRHSPALHRYVTRCQSVLQSGESDNDLLLYWPIEDLWHSPAGRAQFLTVHKTEWLHGQPIGPVAQHLWQRGYAFDYVSDRQLAAARAVNGAVRTAGGSYRAVVVPPCRYIPLETMRKLLEIAEGGVAVVFCDALPGDVAGLGQLAERRAAMAEVLQRTRRVEKVIVGPLDAGLRAAGVARETMTDAGLAFIRRRTEDGRHYFILNPASEPVDRWVPLATAPASAVLMDPMTGAAGVAAVRARGGGTEVYLRVEPAQTVVLRTYTSRAAQGAAWRYWQVAGEPVTLEGPWQIEFIEGGPQIPATIATDRLASWTELGGEEAQRFAGAGVYRVRFDAPGPADAWRLDLGRVGQSAKVTLNGQDLGTLISAPMGVPIDGLRPTGNLLEVEVVNVAANRIRDLDRRGEAWRIFQQINFVNIDYKPFDASGWPLTDSGLLGPVTLTPIRIIQPGGQEPVSEPPVPIEERAGVGGERTN